MKDIGKAIDGPENNRLAAWYNKKPAIILIIQRQPGANVIQTVDRVKAMLPVLQASIPPAIKVDVVSDRTATIRASVKDVQFTLLLSVAGGDGDLSFSAQLSGPRSFPPSPCRCR